MISISESADHLRQKARSDLQETVEIRLKCGPCNILTAPVAQLDRVQPSEGWGRTFDSCLAHHTSFLSNFLR